MAIFFASANAYDPTFPPEKDCGLRDTYCYFDNSNEQCPVGQAQLFAQKSSTLETRPTNVSNPPCYNPCKDGYIFFSNKCLRMPGKESLNHLQICARDRIQRIQNANAFVSDVPDMDDRAGTRGANESDLRLRRRLDEGQSKPSHHRDRLLYGATPETPSSEKRFTPTMMMEQSAWLIVLLVVGVFIMSALWYDNSSVTQVPHRTCR